MSRALCDDSLLIEQGMMASLRVDATMVRVFNAKSEVVVAAPTFYYLERCGAGKAHRM